MLTELLRAVRNGACQAGASDRGGESAKWGEAANSVWRSWRAHPRTRQNSTPPSHLLEGRDQLKGAVRQRLLLVIPEEVGSVSLEDVEEFVGEFADFRLGERAAALLQEVPQGAGIGGDEDLRLG